jgi:predicted regulator of Ras-like GTPase activity (Roadblock/LC7/MglB family)
MTGGGIHLARAGVDPGPRNVYVAIAPCRLFDTRAGADNIGPRNTPLSTADTFTAQVTGTNGNCTIPANAVAIVTNVTAVSPTASSFITVYPADLATRPTASNLNVSANQAPQPNLVTTTLSATGAISVYNHLGTVDLIADITGYYTDHNHDDRYYTKPQADALLTRVPTPANTGHAITRADAGNVVGYFTSVIVGSDGLPIISYYDATNADLKVVHCSSTNCASGDVPRAVDQSGDVGSYTSMTIGRDGLPIISYYDSTNGDLKVVHCTTVACSTNDAPRTIDNTANVGHYTSITIGVDGLPIISYYDITNTNLKVVHCTTIACTTNDPPRTVDNLGETGAFTSITIGVDGLPIISYYDITNTNLMIVHCTTIACTTNDAPRTVDNLGIVGLFTSMNIGVDGLPIVSYYDIGNADLKIVHCTNVPCTTNDAPRVLDQSGSVGKHTSITIGSDGMPIISYNDASNTSLKVVHCTTIACVTNDPPRSLDNSGEVGEYTSITIGIDALPIITYTDLTDGDLRVVHCSNEHCIPYHRQR